MNIQVLKFGGTSMGSGDRIHDIALLIAKERTKGHPVVVASAMSGVTDSIIDTTDALLNLSKAAGRTTFNSTLHNLRQRHIEALSVIHSKSSDTVSLSLKSNIEAIIEQRLAELSELWEAICSLQEVSLQTRDRLLCFGEKLSVPLLSFALQVHHQESAFLYADEFILTDERFGEAGTLAKETDLGIQQTLMPLVSTGVIPIITGFCGQTKAGKTTTFGRGGSDLSATIIGAALNAKYVTLWSDVDGIFSADPRKVPEATVIPQLHYKEAAEMSFYGAKVLHQRTMIPVIEKHIPVYSRNTFNPEAPGTLIHDQIIIGSHPVKACTAVQNQAIILIEGNGMAGVPGIAATIFSRLSQDNVSVTMISQSSSEVTITLAVPEQQAALAQQVLEDVLHDHIKRGLIEGISIRPQVALIAVVGYGMKESWGVSGRVLTALGHAKVNALAIAQGSSELNISIAVDMEQCIFALRAIHREFALHKIDIGIDARSQIDLVLFGYGQIASHLIHLLDEKAVAIKERFGLTLRVVCVIDRSGYTLHPQGFRLSQLVDMKQQKSQGVALAQQANGISTNSAIQALDEVLKYRLGHPIVIDLTDSVHALPVFLRAAELDTDLVSANKAPLATDFQNYQTLMNTYKSRQRLLKFEATVGAGLPVIETIEMLLATGDEIESIEGCFSGTLGLLTSLLEDGTSFSHAVADAIDRGYTEPDPALDLSGIDVERKAIILGRTAGLLDQDMQLTRQGMVADRWIGQDRQDLFNHLEQLNQQMNADFTEAKTAGYKLRFMARITKNKASICLDKVSAQTAIGQLKGTDNIVVIHSKRYHDRPLVISGPGAGPAVTAMGVLGDLLRIAAERA